MSRGYIFKFFFLLLRDLLTSRKGEGNLHRPPAYDSIHFALNVVFLLPGHKTDVFVVVTSFQVHEDIRSTYGEEERGCRFADEHDKEESIFQEYSTQSCR